MTEKSSQLHPEMIKTEVRLKFGSLTAVAALLGLSVNSVSGAIRRPGNSFKTERRIADLLEVSPQSLWPERYDAEGRPRSGLRESARCAS